MCRLTFPDSPVEPKKSIRSPFKKCASSRHDLKSENRPISEVNHRNLRLHYWGCQLGSLRRDGQRPKHRLAGVGKRATSTSLRIVNGEPAILVERSQMRPGHASFFSMHCELDEDLRMQRLHFVLAPSKLSALISAS